ncbi:MAG: GntR family transcriptional regulator [Burkholderiaceae bacterium]|nr:GntR family transcriptional regulator [Burkholderiaceae bacterium]
MGAACERGLFSHARLDFVYCRRSRSSFSTKPMTFHSAPEGKLGAKHPTLRQAVTEAIRQSIFSGKYQPGERLVEEQLANELGVSRYPVGEALRALQAEGLVEISPRRGAAVAKVSQEEANEIVELRASLEGLCARLATRRCGPDDRTEIADLLSRGERASAADDSEALAGLHAEVHALMARIGRNRHLNEFIQSLRDKTVWLYSTSLGWRARQSWAEHAAILAAVASGDEDLAAILSSRHVLNVGASHQKRYNGPDSPELLGAAALPQLLADTLPAR